jgi:hypothetical protein
MAYSKELEVFWFNPPRCATRSTQGIQKYFGFVDYGTHSFPIGEQKNSFFISNIRNPYPRLVSLFNSIFLNENRDIQDFKIFIKRKIHNEITHPQGMLNYQINLSLTFESISKYPDYFVRTENLFEDISNIWFIKEKQDDRLKEIFETTINHNGYFQEYGKRPYWKEYYDEETAEIVYDYLKKDFKLGNYEKNSWKNGTP